MENLLSEPVIEQIRQVFRQLKEPVQILFFSSGEGCETCQETRQLLQEVVAIDDRLGLTLYDFDADRQTASRFNVTRAPSIVIAARDRDHITNSGVQFLGIPAGHEFATLINDILLVSARDSGLSAAAREFLKDLEKPLHLQVFVTPT